MSTHIAAKEGQIADTVLLPGDPLRAKYIAENFLKDTECYTSVRNMFGFTGTYKGKRITCLSHGMACNCIDSTWVAYQNNAVCKLLRLDVKMENAAIFIDDKFR